MVKVHNAPPKQRYEMDKFYVIEYNYGGMVHVSDPMTVDQVLERIKRDNLDWIKFIYEEPKLMYKYDFLNMFGET